MTIRLPRRPCDEAPKSFFRGRRPLVVEVAPHNWRVAIGRSSDAEALAARPDEAEGKGTDWLGIIFFWDSGQEPSIDVCLAGRAQIIPRAISLFPKRMRPPLRRTILSAVRAQFVPFNIVRRVFLLFVQSRTTNVNGKGRIVQPYPTVICSTSTSSISTRKAVNEAHQHAARQLTAAPPEQQQLQRVPPSARRGPKRGG